MFFFFSDLKQNEFVCRFLSGTLDDFSVKYLQDGKVDIQILTSRKDIEISSNWVNTTLKPKIINWSTSSKGKHESQNTLGSHQLIDAEEFNSLYVELKSKYSKKVLEVCI